MKVRIHVISLLLATISLNSSATIHTLHNDPLYNAEHATFALAYAAAAPHDTILVHGSASSYGSIQVFKPLTLIGPGHDLANGERATFGNIQLFAGADSCLLEGLDISGLYLYDIDVVVRACRFTNFLQIQGGGDGALILGNVFINSYLDIYADADNIEVAHNYFSQSGTTDNFRNGSSTTLVHHNVFVKTSTSTSSGNEVFNGSSAFTVFADNVFHTATIASFNISDCPNYVYQNNLTICDEGSLPSLGPNNLDNIAPTWNLTSGSPLFDYGDDYNMLSGTPLTGASDGGQVGVMGGNFPLNSDGRPRNIPYVTSTQLETPYVPENGTIDVNFQAEQGQP